MLDVNISKFFKIVCVFFLVINIFSINVQTADNLEYLKNISTSLVSPLRQKIGTYDEGSHYRNNSYHQEWWYYVANFNKDDSELKNWSMMISFNQMGIIDMLFCAVMDENNITYGGVTNKCKELQALTPGVYVKFNNSYVYGSYPKWQIYAEYKKTNETTVIIDVCYKANTPPMWLFLNTGLNRSTSRIGHYCIIECEVNGTVIIGETSYKIQGVGYHEHSWINGGKIKHNNIYFSSKLLRNYFGGVPDWQLLLDVWDWGVIFFDNGWNMFCAKICQQSPFSKILPGSLWITTDKGENIIECRYFQFKYIEMINTSIPTILIPKKIYINAFLLHPYFKNIHKGFFKMDLYIEVNNFLEFSWYENNIYAGVWDVYCNVYGHVKLWNTYIDINGFGILEFTRAKNYN